MNDEDGGPGAHPGEQGTPDPGNGAVAQPAHGDTGPDGGPGAPAGEQSAPDPGNESGAQSTSDDTAVADGPRAQDPKKGTRDSGKELVAQVIGNVSLITAVLVYMGWAYENSLLQHFHVSALSLNLSVLEYVLKSTPFFFDPTIILGAVIVVVVVALVSPILGRLTLLPDNGTLNRILRGDLAVALGVLILATLVWLGFKQNALAAWFATYPGVFYLVIALVGAGSLIMTWPGRAHHGIFSFSLAIVIAAVSLLWITGLYADSLGTKAAVSFANNLPAQKSVALYSVQALGLSGPGVMCRSLPDGSLYRYRYTGLRLLYAEPGIYYLLPVGWTERSGPTYIFESNDQLRIELGNGDFSFGAVGTPCAPR